MSESFVRVLRDYGIKSGRLEKFLLSPKFSETAKLAAIVRQELPIQVKMELLKTSCVQLGKDGRGLITEIRNGTEALGGWPHNQLAEWMESLASMITQLAEVQAMSLAALRRELEEGDEEDSEEDSHEHERREFVPAPRPSRIERPGGQSPAAAAASAPAAPPAARPAHLAQPEVIDRTGAAHDDDDDDDDDDDAPIDADPGLPANDPAAIDSFLNTLPDEGATGQAAGAASGAAAGAGGGVVATPTNGTPKNGHKKPRKK